MFDVWLYKIRLIAVALRRTFLLVKNGHICFLYSQTLPILFINQHLSINVNFYKHELGKKKEVKDHAQHIVHHNKAFGQKPTFSLKTYTQLHKHLCLDDSAKLLMIHRRSDRRRCMPQMVLMTWHLSTFSNHGAVCKMCSRTFPFHSQAKGDQKRYWEDLACPPPSTSGMWSHTFWTPTWCLPAYSCSSPTCCQEVKQENLRGILAWWGTRVKRGSRLTRDTPSGSTLHICKRPLWTRHRQTKQTPRPKVNENSFSLVLVLTGKRQHCSSEYCLDWDSIYAKPSTDTRKIWNLLKNYCGCKSCFEFIANFLT